MLQYFEPLQDHFILQYFEPLHDDFMLQYFEPLPFGFLTAVSTFNGLVVTV